MQKIITTLSSIVNIIQEVGRGEEDGDLHDHLMSALRVITFIMNKIPNNTSSKICEESGY